MSRPSLTTSHRTLWLLCLSLVVSIVAAIDAAMERHWDGAALVAVAVVAQVALVVRLRRGRRPVALR